jgi:hypothetical protein
MPQTPEPTSVLCFLTRKGNANSEFFYSSMDWDTMAAIFQHHAKIRFADNGELHDDLTYNFNVAETPDPLKHLELLGWPTVLGGKPTLFQQAVKTD